MRSSRASSPARATTWCRAASRSCSATGSTADRARRRSRARGGLGGCRRARVVDRRARATRPASYAETWIRDGGTQAGTPEFERLCRAWLDDFDRRGVTAVGFGYLLLRDPRGTPRPSVAPSDSTPRSRRPPPDSARTSRRCSRPTTGWRTSPTREVLATRFAVAGDVTEERSHWPGEQDPTVIVLRQGGAPASRAAGRHRVGGRRRRLRRRALARRDRRRGRRAARGRRPSSSPRAWSPQVRELVDRRHPRPADVKPVTAPVQTRRLR